MSYARRHSTNVCPGNRVRYSRSGIAQAREHEVDRGTGGIDGSVEVAPPALDTNVGLIDTPGLVGWFEMTAQPLLQFGTVALDPAPDGRVVRFQAALAEQLFDIAKRERIPKVPAHGAQNQLGLGLSPLKDRRSDCLLHDLFRLPAAVGQSCNTTFQADGSSTDLQVPSSDDARYWPHPPSVSPAGWAWAATGGLGITGRAAGTVRSEGIVKLTNSQSIDPQDTGLEPAVNPPC